MRPVWQCQREACHSQLRPASCFSCAALGSEQPLARRALWSAFATLPQTLLGRPWSQRGRDLQKPEHPP
eukprot:4076095-Alexandrium_andersonii.AAC.1